MKLFELREPLFETPCTKQLKDLSKRYHHKLWQQWKTKYPDEKDINNADYMEAEFNRNTHSLGGWIFSQIDKGYCIDDVKIIGYPKSAKRCSTKIGRCYYNALDFVMKNGTQFGDLAFAFFIDKRKLEGTEAWIASSDKPRPFLFEGLSHAVVISKNGDIIDPTLDDDQAGNIAVYEKVPESEWRNFKYTPNDANHDARDFYDDYILKKIDAENKTFDFKKWFENTP